LIPEAILRLVYREEEVDGNYWGTGAFEHSDSVGYVHKAGFEGYAVRPGVFVSPVSINSMGLRQANLEHQLEYPSKLLILGDSYAFGLGVLEEQGFPALVQSALNASGIGVINGAQAGYSVEQERLFGMALSDSIRPRVVLLCLFAPNDVRDDYERAYKNIDVRFGYRLSKSRPLPLAPIDFVRTHSFLWRFTRRQLERRERGIRISPFRVLARTKPRAVIKPTVNAAVMLRDYCEDNRIILGIVIIRPKLGRSMFNEHLKAAFEKEGIEVLDLADKDFDKTDYFEGDNHWNESGHKKAAQHVIRFVNSLLDEQ
jgi:hypothetical protein